MVLGIEPLSLFCVAAVCGIEGKIMMHRNNGFVLLLVLIISGLLTVSLLSQMERIHQQQVVEGASVEAAKTPP